MSRSLISIIIPTHNSADRLVDTLESVLAQTYRTFEIVIVDDGSKDNTAEVLQPYWQFVRYHFREPHGLSTALNAGIRESNGDLIAFALPGTRWLPGKLEWQCRTRDLFGAPYGVCLTAVRHADEANGDKTDQDLSAKAAAVAFSEIERPAHFVLRRRHVLDLSSVMVERVQLERAGGFDENMVVFQERDLLFRLGLQTRFCFVNKALTLSPKTRDEPIQEWDSDADLAGPELSAKQYMYEKWLRIVEDRDPHLRARIERTLANIHDQWADRSLTTGSFEKALEELAMAARIHFRPGLAAKRMVVALAPEFSRRLWGGHVPQTSVADR